MLEIFQELRAVPGRVPYAAYAAAMKALEAQRGPEDSQNAKRGVASKQLKIFEESLEMGISCTSYDLIIILSSSHLYFYTSSFLFSIYLKASVHLDTCIDLLLRPV